LFLKYPSLICLIVIILYPQYAGTAALTLAALHSLSATLFYLLTLFTIIGTKRVSLLNGVSTNEMIQGMIIQVVSIYALITLSWPTMPGLIAIAFYVLPYTFISLAANTCSTLIAMGILEIRPVNSEDEE
jgi:hypothetical protein